MNNELISLNPTYSTIPLNEESHCMGRVVGKLKKVDRYERSKRKNYRRSFNYE